MKISFVPFKLAAALVSALLCGAPALCAADSYDDALTAPGRTTSDLNRDASDRPAEVLRFAGIRPGMQIADIVAGSGYYTELLSRLVGPTGKVWMINNKESAQWSSGLETRLAGNRLPNVQSRIVDLNAMHLPSAKFDAIVLAKVYHDLYWVDAKNWPRIDVDAVLNQISDALKPGGILIVIDHSAKPGTGTADASRLHRIDEAFAIKDFGRHGLVLVKQSDLLKRPDDKRDQLSYLEPMLGKTDRFLLIFRRP